MSSRDGQAAELAIDADDGNADETGSTDHRFDGHVECYGYSSTAGGWLFYGWLARRDRPAPERCVVTAHFPACSLSRRGVCLFYRREDLQGRGHGFVAFLRDRTVAASDPLASLGIDVEGERYHLDPASNEAPVSESRLESNLAWIVTQVDEEAPQGLPGIPHALVFPFDLLVPGEGMYRPESLLHRLGREELRVEEAAPRHDHAADAGIPPGAADFPVGALIANAGAGRVAGATPPVAPDPAGGGEDPHPPDIIEAPKVSLRFDAGKPVAGFAIDRVVRHERLLVVEGWCIGDRAVTLQGADGTRLPATLDVFQRRDVVRAYDLDEGACTGFILAHPLAEPLGALTLRLAEAGLTLPLDLGEKPAGLDLVEAVVLQHAARARFLLDAARAAPAWAALILRQIGPPPEGFLGAAGHIEQAGAIAGVGGLVVGWSIGLPPHEVVAVADDGTMRSLAEASRWHRTDVADAYAKDFGTFSFDAGFLVGLHGPVGIGRIVSLVVLAPGGAYLLSQVRWEAAPIDPVSYARWAFDFPTSMQGFSRRIEQHDAPILGALIKARNRGIASVRSRVLDFGAPRRDPTTSIIVPLYGRFDFMQHQLLEFDSDAGRMRHAEVIYVVDDPRIADDVAGFAEMMSHVVDMPFRVVLGAVNRGYAGANNLGVAVAGAADLLFLNSDVIPTAPGWLDVVAAALADPAVGAVGARLHNHNMSLQHDHMAFEWDGSWQAYLNKHPGAGLRPAPPVSQPVPCRMVTAACLLMSRALYDEVGGFDDEFLIGDFEDSDLCLKVGQRGRTIVSVQDVGLVHLERQSFSGVGSNSFREKVARYNAARHQKRWGSLIASFETGIGPQ